jgi:hypothetical protein
MEEGLIFVAGLHIYRHSSIEEFQLGHLITAMAV